MLYTVILNDKKTHALARLSIMDVKDLIRQYLIEEYDIDPNIQKLFDLDLEDKVFEHEYNQIEALINAWQNI